LFTTRENPKWSRQYRQYNLFFSKQQKQISAMTDVFFGEPHLIEYRLTNIPHPQTSYPHD